MFRLSYREGGRKNEFDVETNPTQTITALGRLARITSRFPVAFAPVTVSHPDDYSHPDWLLQPWGKLGRAACFLDGGVLDNKPFSYTVDAIFGRLADREIERLLFYVEPDPERFGDPLRVSRPNVLEAAVAALVSIPGYESIGEDLARIKDRNDRIQRYEELRETVRPSGPAGGSFEETPQDGFARLKKQDPLRAQVYFRSRLGQLRDRAVAGMLKRDGRQTLMDSSQKHAARMLVESFQAWPGDGLDTLIDFDVYYRLRRVYHLVYRIHELLYKDRSVSQPELYRQLWRKLNHQIKLLEIVRFSMEDLIDCLPFDWTVVRSERDLDAASRLWQRAKDYLLHTSAIWSLLPFSFCSG